MVMMHKKISFVCMYRINIIQPIIFLLFFLISWKPTTAQRSHFIYLQHDQSAAFYVKYQGQIIRSSSQGYLLLSKLGSGRHIFYIGQDQASSKLLKFVLDTLEADKGYLIKNLGASGWGLYDLQSSAILYPVKEDSGHESMKMISQKDSSVSDPFGNMLADVTKDSTVKYVSLKKVEKKTDSMVSTTVQVKIDSSANVLVKTSATADNSTPQSNYVRAVIVMQERRQTDSSVSIRFLVKQKDVTDTVRIWIEKEVPAAILEAGKVKEEESTGQELRKEVPTDTLSTVIQPEKSVLVADSVIEVPIVYVKEQDTALVDVMIPEISDSIVVIKASDRREVTSQGRKNDCKKVGKEEDFIRLRKKMAGQKSEDNMIDEAIRFYKQMCLTSAQIGQLSVLISSDSMKYKFFEASYKHVADAEKFSTLSKYLQDENYSKQFEALISKP